MFYLSYLCLLAHEGVQNILRFFRLRLEYPMLSVSMDVPFLITPSLFFNVYFALIVHIISIQ